MKKCFLGSLIFALFLVQSGYGQDAAKGKELYAKKCVTCHGTNGEGKESQKAPRLAGQYDWYVITQLKAFINKERNNPKMLPFIKGLSEQDFKDLAAHISSLK